MTIALYEELVNVLDGKVKEHQTSGKVALNVQRVINAVNESVIQNRAIQLPYWPKPGTLARTRNRLGAQKNLVVSTLMFPDNKRSEILEPIAKSGFQDIDIWMVPGWGEHLFLDEDIQKVKKEFQELGLSVPMMSYYDQAPVLDKLKFAKELGVKVAVSGGFNAKTNLEKVKSLKEELDLAYELGIKIAYENHYGELNTIQDMVDFIEAVDHHPAAGICLAPTHLALYGDTAEDAIFTLKDRIFVIYIWDMEVYTTQEEADLSKEDNWWENGVAQTPGASDIDFRSYLTAAVRYAPEALWSLTWHGTYDWGVDRIIGSLKQAANVVDKNRPLNVDSVYNRKIK
jgi:sugar phosphate isomerase/epimerase